MNKKIFKDMYNQMRPDEGVVDELKQKISTSAHNSKFSFAKHATVLCAIVIGLCSLSLFSRNYGSVAFGNSSLARRNEETIFVFELNDAAKYYYADVIIKDNYVHNVLVLDGNFYNEVGRYMSCYHSSFNSTIFVGEHIGKTTLVAEGETPTKDFECTVYGYLFTFTLHGRSPIVLLVTPDSALIIFKCVG